MCQVLQKLRAKEAPYLLTLLFAAAGWSVTHVVDRIVESPTIEMDTNIFKIGDAKTFRVSLTNLSRKSFSDFTFDIFSTEKGVEIKNPRFEAPQPAWSLKNMPRVTNNAVSFEITQFHPEWHIAMSVDFTGDKPPKFVLKKSEKNRPIRLLNSGLETYFAKNEFLIMILLGGVWLSLAFLWIILA